MILITHLIRESLKKIWLLRRWWVFPQFIPTLEQTYPYPCWPHKNKLVTPLTWPWAWPTPHRSFYISIAATKLGMELERAHRQIGIGANWLSSVPTFSSGDDPDLELHFDLKQVTVKQASFKHLHQRFVIETAGLVLHNAKQVRFTCITRVLVSGLVAVPQYYHSSCSELYSRVTRRWWQCDN